MEDARRILRPRREDAHKGDFGHALLVCGSYGMAGAAVLATMGALRSGCGLVTVHLPASERAVIFTVHARQLWWTVIRRGIFPYCLLILNAMQQSDVAAVSGGILIQRWH